MRQRELPLWKAEARASAFFRLPEAILRDPLTGIGKPEALQYFAKGAWSRRLTQEHRVVYIVSDKRIDFVQARYHY